MPTAADVQELFVQRKRYHQDLHLAMREVRDIYENKERINLPEVDKDIASAVPNLLAQGVDQMAGRIASVPPNFLFASENPGNRAADRRADQARRVVGGWYQKDRVALKMRQRARHLIAYGMSPVVVRFDTKLHRPVREVRDPCETYPSPEAINGTCAPTDVIFAYKRSVGWLRAQGWGDQVASITNRTDTPTDQQMTMLEYVDPTCRMLVLTGTTSGGEDHHSYQAIGYETPGSGRSTMLAYQPIAGGIMTCVVPTRITLSKPAGQFDSMIGMYRLAQYLMALELAAVDKGVFPDTYLVGRPGEVPKIIDGPHDGRSGLINIVQGGDVKEIATAPGYMTPQTIDRLERAQRLTAGIPQDFGGESGANIRTGQRGANLLSAVIDFPVGEAQELFSYSLTDENEAAIALAKAYDGSASRTLYVGVGNEARAITYIADKVFTHGDHVTTYPVSGTDLNSLMIGLGQRVGMGIMSKELAASLDPFIASPELEHDRMQAEAMEQSLMAGIQQKVASGEMPPIVLAQLISLVKNDKMELAEAMVKVAEDAAKLQAEQAQAPPGGPPPTAEQQAAPGAQASLTGGPSIPGAAPAQQDLASLMSNLRQPVQTKQPLRGAAQGAM